MVSLRSTPQSRRGPSQLLILAVASLLVAAVSGVVFGIAVSLVLHLPTPTSVPTCPAGTTLYTRTILLGKALVPIQHCFRDTDAQDPQP
jgi:hypothetical protein